jgi:hypothetical protein
MLAFHLAFFAVHVGFTVAARQKMANDRFDFHLWR